MFLSEKIIANEKIDKIKKTKGVKIFAIIGASTQLEAVTSDHFPTVALRPKNSILNTERIEKTLSLKIPSWENALKRCLKRIQSNETI